MKIITLILAGVLFSSSVFGQTEVGKTLDASEVTEIRLARDDGNGKAVEEAAESFAPTDIPIHCSVRLASLKAVTVKMDFTAVKVAGVEPETKVVTVSYKTNGKQNRVNFTGSPETLWAAGDYRIDVYVDDKAGGSKSFEIKQAAEKAEDVNSPNKNSLRRNPKPKPKITKRFRKN